MVPAGAGSAQPALPQPPQQAAIAAAQQPAALSFFKGELVWYQDRDGSWVEAKVGAGASSSSALHLCRII